MAEITDVRIKKVNIGNIKAFVSVTFDNEYVVHGIKVLESKGQLWVSMPSSKTKSGYRDVFHPITKEARENLINAVLEKYKKMA